MSGKTIEEKIQEIRANAKEKGEFNDKLIPNIRQALLNDQENQKANRPSHLAR